MTMAKNKPDFVCPVCLTKECVPLVDGYACKGCSIFFGDKKKVTAALETRQKNLAWM